MSEVASRPSASRGRGSGRGSRGGFAGRGGRTGRTSSRTNGDSQDLKHENLGAFEDGGEFGELRKLYGSKTSVIREMFPDWSEADVLFALQETNGDENEAVARIAEGAYIPLPSATCFSLTELVLFIQPDEEMLVFSGNQVILTQLLALLPIPLNPSLPTCTSHQ